MFAFAGKRPSHLGVQNSQLVPCPSTPNCVCSQSTDPLNTIDPLIYSSTAEQAWADLKQIIQSLGKTKIVSESQDYLYVEFTSAWMGFVDDVEFYLDGGTNAIQVRSASRLGKSDLGVNRKRVETIRAKLNAMQEVAKGH